MLAKSDEMRIIRCRGYCILFQLKTTGKYDYVRDQKWVRPSQYSKSSALRSIKQTFHLVNPESKVESIL